MTRINAEGKKISRKDSRRLRELVDNDVLEHPTTRSIAQLVAEGGLSILAPDQRYIYDLYIKPHLSLGLTDGDREGLTR